VTVGLFLGNDGNPHQFAVELTADGCLIDWRSLTGWTGTEWTEFLDQRPITSHIFCVSVVPDTLYAGPYSRESEWLCLRIEDVHRQRPAWAYIRRDSPAARKLPPDVLNGFATAPRRFTIQLQFPRNSLGEISSPAALMEITGVVCEGWFDAGIPGDLSTSD
jgi:hypothetical protein